MFELKKYRGVLFHDTEELSACGLENDMRNLENFYRLKNSNFILQIKMVELNQESCQVR